MENSGLYGFDYRLIMFKKSSFITSIWVHIHKNKHHLINFFLKDHLIFFLNISYLILFPFLKFICLNTYDQYFLCLINFNKIPITNWSVWERDQIINPMWGS